MPIITDSEKATLVLGRKLGRELKGGEIIGLIGSLGAGKTIFAKGLAQGLGLKRNINSPTFVIMKVYPLKNKKIKNFIHIDAYRLKIPQDLISIGAEDYFKQPTAVTVIEWADKIKKILPDATRFIKIEISENKRKIIVN